MTMDEIRTQLKATAIKAGVAARDELLGSKIRRRRTVNWILFAALAVVSCLATRDIGYLFGWIIGASLSPIAPAVAPLVFGLLAVVGLHAGLTRSLTKRRAIVRAIFVAYLVTVFCFWSYRGIKWGGEARGQPFESMKQILGDEWASAENNVVAEIHAFRWRSINAGVSFREFEPFLKDVIAPILADEQPEKLERVRQAISTVEASLPAGDKKASD